MLPRIAIPLIAAAGLVFACGPGTPNPVANARPRSSGDRGLISRVVVDTVGDAVRFAIEVVNDSRRRVELAFPDGRTHDFTVLDATGREVWRWSTGRLFTQAMQNRLLDARDAAIFDEQWTAAAPGQYTLVAQLRSDNYPVQQRIAFTLH